ncbi:MULTISPECIES: ketoacyl-ACP synthase III family protein [unclassified Micromonospora]|uniref:ketoacyl-ACP synthase III family protein n=1 Tax=unclassified Micromonospora TaxID=2617518 RepID=UPI0022BFD1A5|nr:ketoacyl-ACP synthase III family protein [Micromonospora sp. AKA38]GHJ15428.1 3-oxoacyl-[acyl-carrier-protein] synthase 3 [Micromonospora sp. AKA38]
MRWADVYLAGTGAYLPERRESARRAVATGRYDAAESTANGIRAVRVAGPAEPPPVMAVAAARQALDRAGRPTDGGPTLVIHASLGHQGLDFWTPAHYIRRETIGGDGPTFEIRHSSNGGMAAIETAAAYLTAMPAVTAAVITAADAFALPYVDRWRSENQQVYGDGAGALVLTREPGLARLVATATVTDSGLEPIYRGAAEWVAAPMPDGGPVDLRGRKREYLLLSPERYDEAIEQTQAGLRTALDNALADAGITVDGVDLFVHPVIGETVVAYTYGERLGIPATATLYDWGRDIGHLGAADQFVQLHHLLVNGLVRAGRHVVAIGSGAGFGWTVAVWEILPTAPR